MVERKRKRSNVALPALPMSLRNFRAGLWPGSVMASESCTLWSGSKKWNYLEVVSGMQKKGGNAWRVFGGVVDKKRGGKVREIIAL